MYNNKPLAALTFDDGPNTVTTPQVIDKLEKYGVIAVEKPCSTRYLLVRSTLSR